MIELISVIHLLNNNRDAVKILTNSKSLSSVVTANAEKHPEGYLVNNGTLFLSHAFLSCVSRNNDRFYLS